MVKTEAIRYIKGRIICSGDKLEYWKYETPIRADSSERSMSRGEDGEKSQHNLLRAQMQIRQLIWSNLTPYTKVLTLTFADAELDIKAMRRKITTFLQAMKRSGYDLKYIWVPEHQSLRGKKEFNEGSLHAHFVIFNDEKIPIEVIKKSWPWGIFDIHIANGCRTNDKEKINSLAAYLSKYISKETVAKFGCRCFNPSLNLKRPEVIDIECYRYQDNNGFYQYTDDGKQDYSDLFNKYNITWKSGYNYTYNVNGDDVTNSVLYIQGDKK